MEDETDQHSSIRFARATRAVRQLGLPECIEFLQLVEGPAEGNWGKFDALLLEHAVDRNKESDRQALRISLVIRRMELEKAQIEEAKKRYPDARRGNPPSDDAE
jgi:hypothetical protein